MKTKIEELRSRSVEELEKMLAETRGQLQKLYFKVAQRELKNVREIRQKKKEVARILTIIKEKIKNKI